MWRCKVVVLILWILPILLIAETDPSQHDPAADAAAQAAALGGEVARDTAPATQLKEPEIQKLSAFSGFDSQMIKDNWDKSIPAGVSKALTGDVADLSKAVNDYAYYLNGDQLQAMMKTAAEEAKAHSAQGETPADQRDPRYAKLMEALAEVAAIKLGVKNTKEAREKFGLSEKAFGLSEKADEKLAAVLKTDSDLAEARKKENSKLIDDALAGNQDAINKLRGDQGIQKMGLAYIAAQLKSKDEKGELAESVQVSALKLAKALGINHQGQQFLDAVDAKGSGTRFWIGKDAKDQVAFFTQASDAGHFKGLTLNPGQLPQDPAQNFSLDANKKLFAGLPSGTSAPSKPGGGTDRVIGQEPGSGGGTPASGPTEAEVNQIVSSGTCTACHTSGGGGPALTAFTDSNGKVGIKSSKNGNLTLANAVAMGLANTIMKDAGITNSAEFKQLQSWAASQ